MKPILYPASEKTFNTNGIGILADAISGYVYEELNGQFELEMQYPVEGIHFGEIALECYLTAKPDPVKDDQIFEIYRITKPMNGIVTIYARHIAYQQRGIVVSPFTAESCADALVQMKNNAVTDCPFSYSTDKTTSAQMVVGVPKNIWKLLGGSEGSFLDTYGGEYEFDNFKVMLHSRRGADRGVSIRYGKNLTSLEQDANCANVYTGVYPYWTDADGNLVTLPEKILRADGTYTKDRILDLNLSDRFDTQPTEDELRVRAKKYMTDNDIGTPTVSWKVEFVQLEQTEEYKSMALLERVLLGDTVSVEFPKMGVSASARAVAAKYHFILERWEYVTLGSVKANLADTIVTNTQAIKDKASKQSVNSTVQKLASNILGAYGGCVRMLDTDGDGEPDELYIADNKDPALAVKVWRYNYEGWAGSKNGYEGPFDLAATLDDGLLASFVTAAHLVAGTIQSQDGDSVFIDLDNGIVNIKALSQVIDDLGAFKESVATEFEILADGVTIAVTEKVGAQLEAVNNNLQAQINEITANYRFTADGQYIGKSDSDTMMRLINDMMQILVSGVAATTVDKRGLTAEEVNVKTIHMDDYTLTVSNGILTLT